VRGVFGSCRAEFDYDDDDDDDDDMMAVITTSMEQIPSLKANSSSASQKIPAF
jgi:hypothetical protein